MSGRAPRMVLPSTAITLRPAMVSVRMKNQEAGAGVGVARSQVLQDPPDRGLRRKGPPRPPRAQGPRVGGGQVGGVLPYRRQAPASRQKPRHGQGQDRGQGVANPAPVPRIGHALQTLSQGLARQGGCGR